MSLGCRGRNVVVAALVGIAVYAALDLLWVSSAVAPVTGLKPQIGGLLDRQGAPSSTYEPVVNGYVVKTSWALLQPVQGGDIAQNNDIDQAVGLVRQRNQDSPGLNMRIKLRVYSGIDAPEWAKHLGGEPLFIQNLQGQGTSGTVGRFWTDAYGQAYQDFQAKLAALYDGVPEVGEIVVSRCTTTFAEPFLRQFGSDSNLTAYRDAGYTLDADKRCQHEEIDAHDVWRFTRSALAFNPYQAITATTTYVDEPFTEEMMVYCRQKLARRCVLGNNSIRSGTQGEDYTAMYEKIKALGKPIYFQTATMDKVGSLSATLDWAASQGAGMVELPAGYMNDMTTSALAPYDTRLEAGADPAEVASPPSTDVPTTTTAPPDTTTTAPPSTTTTAPPDTTTTAPPTTTTTAAPSTTTTAPPPTTTTAPPPTTTTVAPDTVAPSVPGGLALTGRTSSSAITFSWKPSSDNVAVAGYQVFRNGVWVASVATTSYTDTGLKPGTSYTYTVKAYDAAGNVSLASAPLKAKTRSA